MNKIFRDEKIFNKFKKTFKFIFKDKKFIEITANHFNKNGSLAAFTIAFLQSKLGEKEVFDSAKINYDDWINLMTDLYEDNDIKNAFEQLSLNPLITIENIKKTFVCFNNFIDKLCKYIEEQNWSLNIANHDLVNLLSSAYGYILYNCIECKLSNKLEEIIVDPDYDKKYIIVLNNTKLFADAKENIRKHCGQKINDLIVILLGGSNHLALDK